MATALKTPGSGSKGTRYKVSSLSLDVRAGVSPLRPKLTSVSAFNAARHPMNLSQPLCVINRGGHTTPEKQKPLKLNEALDWIIQRIDRIESKVNVVLWFEATNRKRTRKIMATLDDLVAAATEEDTKIDSLIALVVELKAKVDAAVAGQLTPEQQAKIDAAFAAITDNPQRIQDAIDANTPAP